MIAYIRSVPIVLRSAFIISANACNESVKFKFVLCYF
jgi:hypothetical protein